GPSTSTLRMLTEAESTDCVEPERVSRRVRCELVPVCCATTDPGWAHRTWWDPTHASPPGQTPASLGGGNARRRPVSESRSTRTVGSPSWSVLWVAIKERPSGDQRGYTNGYPANRSAANRAS